MSTKKSIINLHIKSAKHLKGKERLRLRKSTEQNIVDALKRYDHPQSQHAVGESLPDSTRVFRVKTVTSFLKCGIPLSKIDGLRELFEENGYSLTSSTHLRQLVPFIHHDETTTRDYLQTYINYIYSRCRGFCPANWRRSCLTSY